MPEDSIHDFGSVNAYDELLSSAMLKTHVIILYTIEKVIIYISTILAFEI